MTAEIATFDSTRGSMSAITGGHLLEFQEWAKVVAVGSVIPDALRGKPADVFVTVMHGLDLGLRPMQALNLVYVVKGRPSLSAEGMRALLLRDGHDFEVVSASDDKVVVRGRRAGTDTWHEASFSDAQRKAAKLSGQNWDAYREDMLMARATVRLCRRHFADVLDAPGERQARPSLQQVAAARTEPVADEVTGEVVDDAAEQQRLRDEVAAMAAQHQSPADDPVDGELLDETSLPAQDSAWPEVAAPGSASTR